MSAPAAAAPLAIRATHLGKSYGATWALRDVSVAIAPGEAVAVFGGNGAGKSTLIRLLATLSPPSLGHLEILGWDAGRHPRRVRPALGVLGQQSYLYADLSATENLQLYAALYAVDDGARAVPAALAAVDLAGVADRRVRDLSRGMQQRLALARAIIHQPAVLLLDEPDSGLDLPGRELLDRVVATGCARGQAVVLATHELELGLDLCGRALILDRGRAVYDAPVQAQGRDAWRARYRQASRSPR